MKICIGDEFSLDVREKISWVRANIPKEKYKITDDGFLINDYYVEFVDEKYATLYYVQYPK